MIQFALFPIEKYTRDQVTNMSDNDICRAINNDGDVLTFTPAEIAEQLNDEAYPTEYWTVYYNF